MQLHYEICCTNRMAFTYTYVQSTDNFYTNYKNKLFNKCTASVIKANGNPTNRVLQRTRSLITAHSRACCCCSLVQRAGEKQLPEALPRELVHLRAVVVDLRAHEQYVQRVLETRVLLLRAEKGQARVLLGQRLLARGAPDLVFGALQRGDKKSDGERVRGRIVSRVRRGEKEKEGVRAMGECIVAVFFWDARVSICVLIEDEEGAPLIHIEVMHETHRIHTHTRT